MGKGWRVVCGVLLLVLVSGPSRRAVAKPCAVVKEPAVRVWGPNASSCSSSTACADRVVVAEEGLTHLPVVLWHASDGKVRLSRYDGAKWGAAALVPAGVSIPSLTSISVTFEALDLASDSQGRLHLIISDGKKVYHLAETKAGSWSKPQVIATISKTNLTGLGLHLHLDSKDQVHVTYWYEAGIGYVRHAVRSGGKWSAWFDVGGGDGRHIDVAVGDKGDVHVVWVARNASVGGLRNWQAFYRGRTAAGKWGAVEQATKEKPVATTIGPVAIHPAVAVDKAGTPHMVYPVDPPDSGSNDDGKAKYTRRTGPGKWTAPVELFTNGRHSALLELEVDAAGVKYAFGINQKRRWAHDPLKGSWSSGSWYTGGGGFWFIMDATVTPAGAWLAHVPARNQGPVEVILFRRTNCGPDAGPPPPGDAAIKDTGGTSPGDGPLVQDVGQEGGGAVEAGPHTTSISGGCGCRVGGGGGGMCFLLLLLLLLRSYTLRSR